MTRYRTDAMVAAAIVIAVAAIHGCATASQVAPAAAAPTAAAPAAVLATEGGALDCDRPKEYGPVLVSATQFALRKGARATRFSDVPSTKESPLEVCDLRMETGLLLSLLCDDGTSPFRDPRSARRSRRGSMIGGRCGSNVDVYEVRCPERSYQVYIDAYVCQR